MQSEPGQMSGASLALASSAGLMVGFVLMMFLDTALG